MECWGFGVGSGEDECMFSIVTSPGTHCLQSALRDMGAALSARKLFWLPVFRAVATDRNWGLRQETDRTDLSIQKTALGQRLSPGPHPDSPAESESRAHAVVSASACRSPIV